MKSFVPRISIIVLITSLVLIGCTSSEQTTERQKSEQPPPAQKPPEQTQAQKIDTLNVNVQKVPPPRSEPAVTPQTAATKWTGKFAVQIGAFKIAEKASQIADIARERFGSKVFTVYDSDRDLTKVLVGDFMTKDEARKYRDQITKQYPDYADAWVTEFPHE